jgi:hypothetical protein
VLRFFKVSPSTAELQTIERASQVYSKEAYAKRAFLADTDAKQKHVSDAVREAAAKWATEPYQLLEQKRLETNHQVKNHECN